MSIANVIKAANKLNETSGFPNRYTQCELTGIVSVSYWNVYTQSRVSEHVGYDDAQIQHSERELYAAMDAYNAFSYC